MSTGAAAANGIISIHAPREGSDGPARSARAQKGRISIHAPREGSDHNGHGGHLRHGIFLSTLPARGATDKV